MKYTVKQGDTETTYEADTVEDIKSMIDAIEPYKCSASNQGNVTASI